MTVCHAIHLPLFSQITKMGDALFSYSTVCSTEKYLFVQSPILFTVFKIVCFINFRAIYLYLQVSHSVQKFPPQRTILPESDKTAQYGYYCHEDLFHTGMSPLLRSLQDLPLSPLQRSPLLQPSIASKEIKYPP